MNINNNQLNEQKHLNQYYLNNMEGTNRSGIQCIEHPNQQITNYCLHFDCLKPLCPDCVEIHTRQHQKQQIQSWKHCVNKSARNVKTTLDQLRNLYDKQNQYQSFKSLDMIQNQNVKKLQHIKDKIIRAVEDTFQMHQQKLRMTIRSQYKIDPPDTTKLKMAIQELEKVLMKLGHSNTVLPALKKSLLLDHNSLLNYFDDIKSDTRKAPLTENFVQESQEIGRVKHILDNYVIINGNTNDIRIQDKYNSPGQFKNSYDPLSSARKSRQEKQVINITQQNYFDKNCRHKLLHFFIPLSRQLKLLNIESAIKGASWKSMQFKSKSQLPCFFKSIITPSGEIYLTGGSQEQKRYRQIYRYNYDKNSLDFVCKMINDRSSHSICYVNNCIYLIGGFTKKDGEVSRQCEVFRLDTQSCEPIAPLNAPSANSSATAFNNSHIFKFGGVLNKNEGNSLIEMYSIKSNKWIVVNIQNSRNTPKIQLLSFSAGVQSSDHQILVFGGYDNSEVERPQRVCYTVEVNPSRGVVLIKNYNVCPLPYAQGFWNNNPLINDRNIYALQNITDQQDELTAIADDRRLLVFNGDRWM